MNQALLLLQRWMYCIAITWKEGSGDLHGFCVLWRNFVKVQWAERCHILQSSYQLQVRYVSNHSFALVEMDNVEDLVNKTVSEMGYSLIHDKQKEVILEFLRGRDVFVSFPVESGKVGATPFCLKYSIV